MYPTRRAQKFQVLALKQAFPYNYRFGILKRPFILKQHIFSLQRAIGSLKSTPDFFVPKRSDFSRWLKLGLAELDYPAEVCFRIVSTDEIQALNLQYRQKNKPTNVLSFPSEIPDNIPQETTYLGDVILCAQIINQEALDQNKEAATHWTHMVLHGLLHLLGYDHIDDKEAQIMETLEIQLLNKLDIANPYEETL